MKNKARRLGLVRAVFVCGLLVSSVSYGESAPDRISLSASGFYTTGKYGRAQSTDIFYLPFTAIYATGPFALQLTVPYISINGTGDVIPDVGAIGPPSSTRRTQSGLGDVRLGVSYRVYFDKKDQFAVDLGLKTKFGTANRSKGLGTGENDYAAEVGAQKALGHVVLGASVGYRAQGSPPGTTLRNVVYGELDTGYRFSMSDSVGLSFLASEASTSQTQDRLLAAAYYKHVFTKNWKSQIYVLKGFSNSSPDYGAGLSIAYSFVSN